MFENVSFSKLRDIGERLQSRVNNMKKRTEEVMDMTFEIGEVTAVSAGFGYANQKWGNAGTGIAKHVEVAGIPADLGVGAVGLLLAVFGGGGKYESHIVNGVAGCFGAAGYRMAADYGASAGDTVATGYLPTSNQTTGADFFRSKAAVAR